MNLRTQIEQRADGRCEYCHAPQSVCGYRFHLEHIVPLSQQGSDALDNRALTCASCNLVKADEISGVDPGTGLRVRLFNPRQQPWEQHFRWESDQKTLTGITEIGRATVIALDMNSALRQEARQIWFAVGLLPRPLLGAGG